MTANAPTLTEAVRIPLHELQADVDYLIGRVVADGSCGAMIAASIKTKLKAIECALTFAPCPGCDGHECDWVKGVCAYPCAGEGKTPRRALGEALK